MSGGSLTGALSVSVVILAIGCGATPGPGAMPPLPAFQVESSVGRSGAVEHDPWADPGHGSAVPAVAVASGAAALAGPLPADDEPWRVSLTAFLWAQSIDGTVGAGALQSEVKEDFDDIVDDIQESAALHVAFVRGDWAILSEFSFYDLSATEIGPAGFVRLDYDEKRTDYDLLVARRVLDDHLQDTGDDAGRAGRYQVSLLGGARYTSMEQDFAFTGPLGNVTKVDEKETWIDPVVGVRGVLSLSNRVDLEGRGDVGGFGVGSELTWTAQAALAWWVSPRATLRIGYRHRDIDYESGDFVYDVELYGPYFSFTWMF